MRSSEYNIYRYRVYRVLSAEMVVMYAVSSVSDAFGVFLIL
jgi:hypothetical protein